MLKKSWLGILAALAVIGSVGAEQIEFRGGDLLEAEFSTLKPNIKNENPLAFELPFDRKSYVCVALKPQRGRNLSIFDYSIELFGRDYPCIALRSGNDDFIYTTDEMKGLDPNQKYALLFVVDGSKVGLDAVEKMSFKANYADKNASREIPVKNIKGGGFRSLSSISDAGNFEVSR